MEKRRHRELEPFLDHSSLAVFKFSPLRPPRTMAAPIRMAGGIRDKSTKRWMVGGVVWSWKYAKSSLLRSQHSTRSREYTMKWTGYGGSEAAGMRCRDMHRSARGRPSLTTSVAAWAHDCIRGKWTGQTGSVTDGIRWNEAECLPIRSENVLRSWQAVS
jgi:hypothetical protein